MVKRRGDEELRVGATIRVLQEIWKRFVENTNFLGILVGDEEDRVEMSKSVDLVE